MSRELTEKNRRNISRFKGGLDDETVNKSANREQAPYSPDTQADLTEVENNNPIPTDLLLNCFINSVKQGAIKVESKNDSDRQFIKFLGKYCSPTERQQLEQDILENEPPTPNNYHYTFTNGRYDPVDFSITKIKKTYGFRRHDTGEYGNFTIIKGKSGYYTFKPQPIDEFNIPEWVEG